MFRVVNFMSEISSAQGKDGYQSRTEIILECGRSTGDWPEKFWPCECRIAGAAKPGFDKTPDGHLVLGTVRLNARKKAELNLIAGEELARSFLSALNQDSREVFLVFETTGKVAKWSGEGWIPVLSYSLAIGKRVR